ncbi:MAG: peptidase, partial [Bacteroidales bacterium]|nr:peptidase [Bacteroidales bacterium]
MRRLLAILLLALVTTATLAEKRAVVRISVCNMRKTGDYDAEMISQALLGTGVKVFSTGKFNEIETPDG